MATLAIQNLASAGVAPAYVAAAGGGDAMATGHANFLHVKNGGGSPINVTIASPRTCDQGSTHPLVVSVTNGQERMIGPITTRYADPTTGLAVITYSGVTSVTVGAFGVASA
jgi:hypothetical protein